MPTSKSPPLRNHKVAACAYDRLCTFEFGIAVERFGMARPEYDDWYDFKVCAIEPGPLRAMGGIEISAPGGLQDIEQAGTIIIPGWRGAAEPPPDNLIECLQAAHRRGARLVSICSGVFILAATGLLDGRNVTTHWRYAEQLQCAYPSLKVDADVLYVDEGDILTSAGSAAGLDLCLHIIRKDHGAIIANQVAKRLVVPAHREGGQAQYIERAILEPASKLSGLLDWARQNIEQDLKIEIMARRAAMSIRTFERRFKEATGMAPARWLARERMSRARDLLEASDLPVEDVATRSGFGSADTLRHHFRKSLAISPLQYRNSFRG